VKRVTLVLGDEDLENLPIALGLAVGALSHMTDHVLAMRACKRLEAFFQALKLAEVAELPDSPRCAECGRPLRKTSPSTCEACVEHPGVPPRWPVPQTSDSGTPGGRT
jgi:hypothetical protein